jgi:N-formylglutamate amidohydrolase
MAQCAYMDESPPYAFDPARAAALRPLLRACLEAAVAWARGG